MLGLDLVCDVFFVPAQYFFAFHDCSHVEIVVGVSAVVAFELFRFMSSFVAEVLVGVARNFC